MPYRARGTRVMVRRRGRWVLLKVHASARAARSHARALNTRVKH